MRGWLPILALGACLAAGALPAMAGDTQSGVCVEVYHPGLNGAFWRCRSHTESTQDISQQGTSAPHPSGPTTELTDAGVTVARGGDANPPTIEQTADGVTVIRGHASHP